MVTRQPCAARRLAAAAGRVLSKVTRRSQQLQLLMLRSDRREAVRDGQVLKHCLPEPLGCLRAADAETLSVAKRNEAIAGAREGHVDALAGLKEADAALGLVAVVADETGG